MELINFMIWGKSDKYDKYQALIEKYRKENERALRVDRREKRLIEEGVDPAAARKKAEEEEEEFTCDPVYARPAPSKGG